MNPLQDKIDVLYAMINAGMISREEATEIMRKFQFEQDEQKQQFVVWWDEISGEQPQRRSLRFPSKESARALRQELMRLTLEGTL